VSKSDPEDGAGAAGAAGAGVSNSDPVDGAGAAGASGAGVSNSDPVDGAGASGAGVSNSDDPPEALAAGPASAVSVMVSSVMVTSPASGSALVATSVDAAAVPLAAFAVPEEALAEAPTGTRVADSPLTDASSICATSRTSTSSRALPAACSAVSPSASITRQKGQPTAIWSAPVATASLVRLLLMRSPMFSSIHMRAPPAPQQKDFSELRSISLNSAPGRISSSSRGGE
jgi:hypothetical protein